MNSAEIRSFVCSFCDYGGQAILAVAISATMLACDAGPDRGATGERMTRGDSPVYRLSDDPVLSIGGHDDRPEYLLQFALGALRLSDGRIVIGDAMSREIRYYSDRGEHIHTSGGPGEGPGEFGGLGSIQRLADSDTVVAWDAVRRRIIFLADSGEFVASVSMNWSEAASHMQVRYPEYAIAPRAPYVLDDRRFLVAGISNRSPGAVEGTRVIQDSVPLLIFDADGEYRGVIGTLPGRENFFHDRIGSPLPYGDRLEVVGGEGLVWVGSRQGHMIKGISVTGEVVRTVTLPIERRALRREDLPRGGTQNARMQAFMAAMPVPDSFPVMSGLRHAADGKLWVQKYLAPEDSTQEWLAFDETGALVASLEMDAGVELLDVGTDFAIVLVTDELDIQEIQMHRLGPGPD